MKSTLLPTPCRSTTTIIKPGDVVLFEGDSITNAFRRPEEINNAYTLGAGYTLLIGSQIMADRPGDRLTFVNRGVAGEKITDLANRWGESCLAIKPNLVSLLVGVNDLLAGTATEEFEATYRSILELTLEELPETRIVICEPFILPSSDMITPAHLREMPRLQRIVRVFALEYDATFVALQSVFDAATRNAPAEYWSYDGIHPTAAGFALIARAWINSVLPPNEI